MRFEISCKGKAAQERGFRNITGAAVRKVDYQS